MPAPARISVPVKQSTPIKPTTITPKTPASIPRPKARVVHRRRARGRLDDTDTDDEDLVREPHSDEESDSPSSMLDSDSETVSESDLEPEEREHEPVRVPSPSHTPLVNEPASSPSPPPADKKPDVFPQSVNWSEMVADENANGAADLPVIDFAELSSAPPKSPTPAPDPAPAPAPASEDASHDTSAAGSHRAPGQSARQAYRTRLDTDPAYVPTVGQFWSHDDRLLDKDLRSLSGWWRGRWQGRGRGRGRGFGGGWRGRGGFHVGPGQLTPDVAPEPERAWTHDGFEEMKKVDEERRSKRGSRARGGFTRAFGGFTADSRLSARPPSESQYSSTASDTLRFGSGTRPWFAMKPERVWTKQFDAYLYFEGPLKPMLNQGLGQGVRVRLPGNNHGDENGIVVRLPVSMPDPPRPVLDPKEPYGERAFMVKLPRGKRAGKEPERSLVAPENITTVASLPMEDSAPVLPPPRATQVETRRVKDIPTFVPARPQVTRRASETQASTSVQAVAEPPNAWAPPPAPNDIPAAGSSHMVPHTPQEAPVVTIPPQPTLQPSAPPFQPSPPYGSPYGYAPPGLPLPPGIAVSESGVTYEISTGRAVFLHTPPPPPPPPQMQGTLYNPRPMPMHHAHHGSVHFLPPPLPHHTSMSPTGFLASPPIFALPRQNSRVSIRAPGEKDKERDEAARDSGSSARSAVNVNAEPFTPAAQAPPMGYYGSEGFDEAQRHHQHMAYQPAPYYYPVGPDGGAPYGYGQYEPQHYEQYAQDPYPQQQQHTGYY